MRGDRVGPRHLRVVHGRGRDPGRLPEIAVRDDEVDRSRSPRRGRAERAIERDADVVRCRDTLGPLEQGREPPDGTLGVPARRIDHDHRQPVTRRPLEDVARVRVPTLRDAHRRPVAREGVTHGRRDRAPGGR